MKDMQIENPVDNRARLSDTQQLTKQVDDQLKRFQSTVQRYALTVQQAQEQSQKQLARQQEQQRRSQTVYNNNNMNKTAVAEDLERQQLY